MPTLTLSKTYDTAQILDAVDLDNWLDDLEYFIFTTRINDDNIQNSGIESVNLADSSVITAKIADSAVTTAKIADSNITTAKIADSNITTAKIADSAVTTAKIADSNVTTAKIAAANVTRGKLSTPNIISSSSSSAQSTTGTVSLCSATITTSGRPILIKLQHDGSASTGYARSELEQYTNDYTSIVFSLYRDGNIISCQQLGIGNTDNYFTGTIYFMALPPSFYFIDTPSTGTYVYEMKAYSPSGYTIQVGYLKLILLEL